MNKNLLAFFLAALSISFPLIVLSQVPTLFTRPQVYIHIQGRNISDIVDAITALHRSDVVLHAQPSTFGGAVGILGGSVFMAFGLMLNAAIVAALYKFYCRRFGVDARL